MLLNRNHIVSFVFDFAVELMYFDMTSGKTLEVPASERVMLLIEHDLKSDRVGMISVDGTHARWFETAKVQQVEAGATQIGAAGPDASQDT